MAYHFKVALVGYGAVGKTALFHRLQTGEYTETYIPTIGVSVNQLAFNTNKGLVTFAIWDCAGQEKFAGLSDGYYIQARCAILMYDVQSIESYKQLPKFHSGLMRVVGPVPMVVVANKEDVPMEERQVTPKRAVFHRKKTLPLIETSVQDNLNLEEPFLQLARQLTGFQDLEFIEDLSKPESNVKVCHFTSF